MSMKRPPQQLSSSAPQGRNPRFTAPESAAPDPRPGHWNNPPEPIATMLDEPRSPSLSFSPDHRWILELDHPSLPPIANLAQPKLALAGIEINPQTWGPAKAAFFTGLRLRPRPGSENPAEPFSVTLPPSSRIRHVAWSSDSRHIAFTVTQAQGIELWVLAIATGEAQPLTGPILNGLYGRPFRWLPPGEGLICKVRPTDTHLPPQVSPVGLGPIVEENLGRRTPARTYTNLLSNPEDETAFEYYFSSIIERIDLQGNRTTLGEPKLVLTVQPSPDGQWLLQVTTHRPFSYQVPLGRFPLRYEVLDRDGNEVYRAAELPLADDIPTAFEAVRPGRRWVSWRADQAATLYWPEALDEGDPDQAVPFRDAIYQLRAPFTATPEQLWKTELRFNRILWGHEHFALGYEAWYSSRESRLWQLNPQTGEAPRLLNTRNYQDAYSHPGTPLMHRGPYGWSVVQLNAQQDSFYLQGRGASPTGIFPFLDRFDLSHQRSERLWQADQEFFERVVLVLDSEAQSFITRRQSQQQPPNYVMRSRLSSSIPISPTQNAHQSPGIKLLSHFQDPLPWYAKVQKELVRYRRTDGLELSGVLYLPPSYEQQRDGPLPMLLWAYPEEHKSRDTASQVTTAENTFSRPGRASALFLLTQGYGLLSGPSMPIVGEGDIEPNDTYVEQLVSSAEAAVDYLVQRGIGTRDQMAIGGHSYGAFTAANLLAHSDLFQAGIARSGAYNRTLTPFGFQGEQRNFWEASETYIQISPFTHAANITAPLLLIHGAEDNNPGTYPLQSQRLYEAIKGLGGTARYVSLPHEGHSYRSREAIGHVLWEMIRWLDQYVILNPNLMTPETGKHSLKATNDSW